MSRAEILRAGLLGLGWLAYLIYAYGLGSYSEILPHPVCPFLLLTGIPCPLCGLTHALSALLHSDIIAALRINPLCFPALISWPIYMLYARTFKGSRARASIVGWENLDSHTAAGYSR
jgi:hypothetical protein